MDVSNYHVLSLAHEDSLVCLWGTTCMFFRRNAPKSHRPRVQRIAHTIHNTGMTSGYKHMRKETTNGLKEQMKQNSLDPLNKHVPSAALRTET